MTVVSCLREIYAFNGDAVAQREARWTDAEAAVIETRPREVFTQIALRPPGHLLLLHLDGANSYAAFRSEGGSSITGGSTLGRLALLPAGRLAELSADYVRPARHMTLLLGPGLFELEADGGDQARIAEFQPSLDLADPVLLERLGELRAEMESPGPLGRLYAESLVAGMAVRLVRTHSSVAIPAGPRPALWGGLPPRQLRLVSDYVEAHLGGEISLADLAAVAGLSVPHFCRAFRQSTGLPPYRYVVQRRVGRAKELLAGSRLPIAEVALLAGFASQSHLNAHFARTLGTTPKRFRERA
jgi:AraC family transcriptional regulator